MAASANDFLGLSGKVAMVVGGGLGLGEATVLNFAKAGAHVAVVDLDPARAEGVASAVRALGVKAVAIAANALDHSAAPAIVAQAEAALGPLDVMATIVGQSVWKPVLEMTLEDWELDHNRNLRYFFSYAQAAAASMVAGGRPGAITAIASVSGLRSAPNHAPYGAAKAGLINLVKSMGVELAPHRVRVNAVAPGVIRTPRGEAMKTVEQRQAWDDKIKDSLIPYGRLGEPKNIADAILFFSSDLASFVTGQTLAVDGGFMAQFLLDMSDRKATYGQKGAG